MKKRYVLLNFLFLIFFSAFTLKSEASTLYWVGNSGLWNDASHWSLGSGGRGGAGVPSANDNVIFDKNSFTNPNETVSISNGAMCHNMEWTAEVYNPILNGTNLSSLEVYGSITLVPEVSWLYTGGVHFKSAQQGNLINTGSKVLNGNVYFDGTGSWQLNAYLMLSNTSTLNLTSGTLRATGNGIICGNLQMSGAASKLLDINNSSLTVKNQIDSAGSSNFICKSVNSHIFYKNYSGVPSFSFLNNHSYHPRAAIIDSVHFIDIRPSCNCNDTAGSLGAGKCCDGKVVITKIFSQDAGPFSYQWSTGATIDSVVGVCASLGTINCIITDSSDLSTIQIIFNVTVPQIIIPLESPKSPRCNGDCNGWIIAQISGGTPIYTYSWNAGLPGNGTVGANRNFIDSGLCVAGLAQTYSLTVTDAHKCRHKFNFALTQPKAIIPVLSFTNILCNGFCDGTATVTNTTGGHGAPYTYKWTPGNQTTTTISSLCPGSYTITVKDDSNCSGTASVTITQPNPLVMNPTQTNVSCHGVCDGTATVSPTGGTLPYTYKWTPPVSTSNTATGLCAGAYKVNLTDANGCKDSASFTITQPNTLNANLTQTNVDCNGNCDGSAKVVPSGGTPAYTYLWSTGATTSSISGLCIGAYWVKVTDAHNCVDSLGLTITQPPAITLNQVGYNIKCNGFCTGAAAVHPSGGVAPYTYLWTPTNNTTDSIGNLCPGVYKIVVTDKNKCKDSVNISITQPPALSITFNSTNVSCKGNCDGSATANVSGGTPGYTYLWNNGKTTVTITALCANTYTVTVHDANGCVATASVAITQPNVLTVSLSAAPNPLKCFGDCNEIISSAVAGGTAPYNYLWAPGGQTTGSISNQCIGVYKLVVTDAHGCKDSASITISEPTQLRDSIKSVTNIKCNGGTGSATVGVKGGTPPYTYSWAPSGGSGTSATGLTAGCYTVTVTDKNGCSVTASACITQPPALTLAISNTGEKCNGNNNGTATVVPSGGTPAYTYSWAPGGQTVASISNLSLGCYTVTVTDANGCIATASTCITQPLPLAAIISATTSSCNICDGSATVTASGGTVPYTYMWTPTGQTTSTATNLCVGSYTVTVTDANGCTATAKAVVNATVKILVTTSSNTVSCFGSCDGIATANPSGGAAPYTYLWNPGGQTGQTATGLCAGSYTVNVTDANGCQTIDSVSFVNPPLLTVSLAQTNVTCVGKCNGTASATPGGGTPPYTYIWSPGGQTTANINNLCVGNDTVTVTDAHGCTVTAFVTITSGASMIPNPAITEPACGTSNGIITLNPAGGTAPYTYLWAPGAQTTQTITGLSAGTYTVTITDNSGCSQQFFILLNNLNGPTLSASNTGSTCADTCDGSATVTVTFGVAPFTYLWNTGATTSSVTALCPGVYACTVKDNNGCITNITDTVKKPIPISPNPSVQNIPCNGGNNGKITLTPTGGTSPYTYSWSNGLTTASGSNLSQGVYTITIRDNVNCDTTISIPITQPTALTISVTSTNITCNGDNDGTATANVSGGTVPYIYSWTNGGVVPTIVNLSAGSYTVTVHDLNGCSGTASVTITQPPALSDAISPVGVSCNLGSDGSATATVSGGTPAYTYNWSNGQTSSVLNNVPVGTYYLTITDANGCTLTDSVKITQPPAITISFTSQNDLCNGDCNGSATANVLGGTAPYAYLWAPGGQTTQTATGLCAGNYVVTVTDAHNCTANNNITITEPQPLLANASATSTSCPLACDGTATSAPSGGTGPYTFKWLPGNNNTATVTNRCGGVDTLILTDKNGCVDTAFVIIPIPVKLSINASTSPSNCGVSNGSITVTPSGGSPGYVYLWAPGGQTTSTVTGLSAGIYTVKVTDSKGCDSTFTVLLNNANGPSSFSNTIYNDSCFGEVIGSIDADPNGGTLPYVYLWTNLPPPGGQGTDSIFNLAAATYTLQVTDSSGCVQFDTVTVTQPAALSVRGVITNAGCVGVCNGSISITPSGGTPPYTYLWSNGATTTTINNLCVGKDTVNITDAHHCTLQQIFTVGQNAILNVTTTTNNILCNGASTGSAKANPSGGGGIYAYNWSPGAQTSQTATNLSAGTYTVTVTDQNGCQGTDSAIVTQPTALTIALKNKPITCNNACDAQSIANVSGGTPPYNYNWTPGGLTTDSISNLCPGTYVVTVTDANGCTAQDSVTFTDPPIMTENHILTNASCNTTPDGDITITVVGGILPYTFSWSNGSTTQNLVNVLPGKYVLTLTDSTGCVIIDSVLLPSDTTVLAEAGNDTSFCLNNPTITLNGNKSFNATSYQWFQLPGLTPLGNTSVITIPTPPAGVTSYLLVTKDGTCSDSDTVVVTVNPPPIADAGPMKTILLYTSTTIGGAPTGPPGSTYHWSPVTGLGGDTNMANPVASPTVTTIYTVTVVGPSGCIATDTVTVFILPQIVIPDGFTPNADGQNDVWNIKNIYLFPNAVVEVFNRWGEQLFYSAGYKTPWDGSYENKPLPVGTYYYIIDLHDPRFPKAYTGPVTIMR